MNTAEQNDETEAVRSACACDPNECKAALAGTPDTCPSDEAGRVVHGIDRRTQEHLCGVRAGTGTDAVQPGLKITCPGCVERLGAYR